MLVLTVLVLLCVSFYFYVKHQYKFWSNLKVPHLPPEFLIGNMRGYPTKYKISTLLKRIYDRFKGTTPIIGLYMFTVPAVIVSDLDLLKNVLVKDFEHFSDRGIYYNEVDDPLSANLVTLPHDKWKPLRTKFSSSFQAARLRQLEPIFSSVSKELLTYLRSPSGKSTDHIIDVTEMFDQYTISTILQTVFGIESKCLGHSENIFCKMGISSMKMSPMELIKNAFLIASPGISRRLGLRFFRKDLHIFFMGLSQGIIEQRQQSNRVKRNDFMDQLIELKENGLTDDQVAAQAFIFFVAGFDTTSKTLAYLFYELAMNPEVQERARVEVQRVYKEHGQAFTYETVKEMTYLSQIVNGTL